MKLKLWTPRSAQKSWYKTMVLHAGLVKVNQICHSHLAGRRKVFLQLNQSEAKQQVLYSSPGKASLAGLGPEPLQTRYRTCSLSPVMAKLWPCAGIEGSTRSCFWNKPKQKGFVYCMLRVGLRLSNLSLSFLPPAPLYKVTGNNDKSCGGKSKWRHHLEKDKTSSSFWSRGLGINQR